MIVAKHVNVPAFTESGQRDVVRLEAGTRFKEARPFDLEHMICASRLGVHSIFYVVPTDLLIQAEDEDDEEDEYGDDLGAALKAVFDENKRLIQSLQQQVMETHKNLQAKLISKQEHEETIRELEDRIQALSGAGESWAAATGQGVEVDPEKINTVFRTEDRPITTTIDRIGNSDRFYLVTRPLKGKKGGHMQREQVRPKALEMQNDLRNLKTMTDEIEQKYKQGQASRQEWLQAVKSWEHEAHKWVDLVRGMRGTHPRDAETPREKMEQAKGQFDAEMAKLQEEATRTGRPVDQDEVERIQKEYDHALKNVKVEHIWGLASYSILDKLNGKSIPMRRESKDPLGAPIMEIAEQRVQEILEKEDEAGRGGITAYRGFEIRRKEDGSYEVGVPGSPALNVTELINRQEAQKYIDDHMIELVEYAVQHAETSNA